jgi:DNA-binding NarL/FixJ family response regulator
MSQSNTIKILIVTDIPDAGTDIEVMLEEMPDVAVVGTAAGGPEAVSLADVHQPDVVVMDYDMPGLNGAETATEIIHRDPGVQVIMLSLVQDPEDILKAMRAGARDYLFKPLADGELVETIRWLIRERREYSRMQSFVSQLRKAYEALFRDDKPVPPTVVAYLETQVTQNPGDRLALETLAVAYARNRDWKMLYPLMGMLIQD